MPTPNETEILRITKEEKEVDTALISNRMRISKEYSALLLNYLVRKNFLEEAPAKEGTHRTVPRYKLTRKGALALLVGLHHAAGKYALAVRRGLYLKDVVDEKINELTDYIEEEFPERKMAAKNRVKGRVSASDSIRS